MIFLPFFIAKRLYLKQNKNYTVLLISILSKIGISVSVFALIISLSALNGFQLLLNKTILSNLPHGILELTNHSLLTWKDLIKKLKNFPEIIYSEPYLITNGLLEKNNKVKFILIKSVSNIHNFKKKFNLKFNNKYCFKKKYKNHIIIISSNLAEYLSIKKGDWINLNVLNKNKNYFNNHLKSVSLKIIDIFRSNDISNANIAYIPFEFFKNFIQIDHDIKKIELHMSDPFKANEIILHTTKKIHIPLVAYTWINSYKDFYNNIKKVKSTVYLTMLLLVIISCVSIACISLMTISKNIEEIAILRSIGANNILIQLIFLYYGLRSIIIGTFIGLLIGIITILNFKNIIFLLEKYFKNDILSNNINYNNFLLFKLNLLDIIIVFLSTLIIGIITNWYPAYFASKINPSKILKEY